MQVLAIFSAPFVDELSSFFWAYSFLSFLCCNSSAILICCLVVTLLSAMRSQLKPRHSSDDYLPVITRILPPRVMARFSLTVTLIGIGELQHRSRQKWSTKAPKKVQALLIVLGISKWLASLCSSALSPPPPMLALLPLLSSCPGMSRPCLWAPSLQWRARTFQGLEIYDFVPGHGRIGPQDSGCVIAHKFGQLRLSKEN